MQDFQVLQTFFIHYYYLYVNDYKYSLHLFVESMCTLLVTEYFYTEVYLTEFNRCEYSSNTTKTLYCTCESYPNERQLFDAARAAEEENQTAVL